MHCIDAATSLGAARVKGTGAWASVMLVALMGVLLGGLSGCAPTRPPIVPTPPVAVPVPTPPPPVQAAPALARDWREYHRLAAQQLVKANPGRTYLSEVPEPLKGIPILEVELNADGSVRQIKVQRRPRPADAQHTTQLAIEAVRRAAPFPPVAHLPKPWSYTEVFLFDDADRFKPRTLDE